MSFPPINGVQTKSPKDLNFYQYVYDPDITKVTNAHDFIATLEDEGRYLRMKSTCGRGQLKVYIDDQIVERNDVPNTEWLGEGKCKYGTSCNIYNRLDYWIVPKGKEIGLYRYNYHVERDLGCNPHSTKAEPKVVTWFGNYLITPLELEEEQ